VASVVQKTIAAEANLSYKCELNSRGLRGNANISIADEIRIEPETVSLTIEHPPHADNINGRTEHHPPLKLGHAYKDRFQVVEERYKGCTLHWAPHTWRQLVVLEFRDQRANSCYCLVDQDEDVDPMIASRVTQPLPRHRAIGQAAAADLASARMFSSGVQLALQVCIVQLTKLTCQAEYYRPALYTYIT
jgi:hypothetical protein